MDLQIAELNRKLDRVLDLLEKKAKVLTETEWSIENYSDKAVIIKFSFNETFKQSVKDLSGKWTVSKKGWMFPLSESEKVLKLLSEQYPTWTFIDKR
jgi:hypothetical protein